MNILNKQIQFYFFLLVIIFVKTDLYSSTEKNKNTIQTPSNKAQFDVQKKEDPNSSSFFPPIQKLFENPTFTRGLQQTTTAINQSFDTLMDSLFYSLLNQTFIEKISSEVNISASTQRKVYSVIDGAYVVIDKFSFGPNYFKKIGEFNKLPINLGANNSVDIFDIYLRSDGQRISERKEVGHFRYLLNNYFWFLPLLTSILPASFNPNHMYNPLNLAQTPFVFPLNKKRFNSMPTGSIRSYQISGGIQIPFDFSVFEQTNLKYFLQTLDFKKNIPYTIFMQGNYRVNVLKKSRNNAWVGLTKTTRKGHALTGIVGNTFYVLSNTLGMIPWAGIPIGLYPLNIEISDIFVNKNDILFSYNLDIPGAETSYIDALKGNFTSSFKRSKIPKSGVEYHFTQNKESKLNKTNNANNLYFLSRKHNRSLEISEIEINDPNGKHFVLEVSKLNELKTSNFISGDSNQSMQSLATIEVDKLSKNKKYKDASSHHLKLKNTYALKGKYPYNLQFFLRINKKLATSIDYRNYVKVLRDFSYLALEEFKDIPIKSDKDYNHYQKEMYLSHPNQRHFKSHVTSTILGKLNIQATILFSYDHLKKIINSSDYTKWLGLGKGYQLEKNVIKRMYSHNILDVSPYYFASVIAYPLKFFNLNFDAIDAFSDIKNQVHSLNQLKFEQDPIKVYKNISSLVNTAHLNRLSSGLLNLSNLSEIPIKIDFFLKPHKSLSPDLLNHFKKINRMTFSSKAKFPILKSYKLSSSKLNTFSPSYLYKILKRPQISSLDLIIQNSPNNTNVIKVVLNSENLKANKPTKIYMRLDTTGAISINQRKLGEATFSVSPKFKKNNKLNSSTFEFYINGDESKISNFLLEQFINFGGTFSLVLSMSQEEGVWSKEKKFVFEYENEKILPLSINN